MEQGFCPEARTRYNIFLDWRLECFFSDGRGIDQHEKTPEGSGVTRDVRMPPCARVL